MSHPSAEAAIQRDVAALGPFFAFHLHAEAPPEPPWRPLRELLCAPGAFLARVTEVRAYLAAGSARSPEAVPLRVAASVTHLGLTARLLSPVLALAAVHRVLVPLDPGGMLWQPSLAGTFPLSLPQERLRLARSTSDEAGATARWVADLVDGPLTDLVGTTTSLSVSPQVLWGNVASAVNAAGAALASAAPSCTIRAREIADLLWERPQLRDAATGDYGTPGFRRRSCCLIYRAAPAGKGAVCGDCVLRRT